MGSLNVLSLIGMSFFWLKFYIFIGLAYILNFIRHWMERIIHGNSKTVICPYKNTHHHVFLSLRNHLFHTEDLIRLDGYSIDEYEF